jgi:cell division septum initiation protein DivIVA
VSDAAPVTEDRPSLQEENERLRARVAELESELVEVQARTNAAVATWQERAYWLDRLHIDLNALMRKPGANQLRVTLKALRAAVWACKRAWRRVLGK